MSRFSRLLARSAAFAMVCIASPQPGFAQSADQFHRTLAVTADPVTLDVELPKGDLQILYNRDGEVSITGIGQTASGARVDKDFFSATLVIEQNGNRIKIRRVPSTAYADGNLNLVYRLDVPYRTDVTSTVNNGKQTITGIMGPVKAVTGEGDIKASYISRTLSARAERGNLDLQVIGERVEARTGDGNISCIRAAQGVAAETGDGDITLMVVGPSTATVKKGSGAIEVGGARGTLVGSTDSGTLHVKAVPRGDWQLNSGAGNIRVELPPSAQFDLDAAATSGGIATNRSDLQPSETDIHRLHQKVNGGGTSLQMRTQTGRIVIQ